MYLVEVWEASNERSDSNFSDMIKWIQMVTNRKEQQSKLLGCGSPDVSCGYTRSNELMPPSITGHRAKAASI